MPNPIPPYSVTTPYGTPGAWAAGYHTGDDYATHGRTGIPVLATHRGQVITTVGLWGPAYGIHVVTMGRFRMVRVGYCHLSSVAVSAWQWVRAGDVIGYSGDTGRVTGPHLHYEERWRPFDYGTHRRPRWNRTP